MWIKYPYPPRLSWALLFYRRYRKQFATFLWAPSSEAAIPLTQQTARTDFTNCKSILLNGGMEYTKKDTRETQRCATPQPWQPKKSLKKNTSCPSLCILCGGCGQLPYGSINCLIYLHCNTQVTLARDLLPRLCEWKYNRCSGARLYLTPSPTMKRRHRRRV